MTIRFISDLHLDEKRPQVCRAFFHYMDSLNGETEALYILGDLFEAWVGDDDDLAFHQNILDKLREKTASGLKIFIMHGNRDFIIGKLFEEKTGCQLISDPFLFEYQDKKILLMHGDSLCIEDAEYQQFREQMRNPDIQAMLMSKTLDERRQMAESLRNQSKEVNSEKTEEIMDVTQSEVERLMSEHQVDTLIHGHTHRPATHQFDLNGKTSRRIVLGDWLESGWEVIVNDDIQLVEFPLQ